MTTLIETLSKPAIHYKVLAAGRHDPKDAFAYVAQHLRNQDAVAVGVFTKDNPDMLRQDVLLFRETVERATSQKPTASSARAF
jgi:hypothetical protein